MKNLGWFKIFFYIIFPAYLLLLVVLTLLEGHAEEVKSLATWGGGTMALVALVTWLNRNTK